MTTTVLTLGASWFTTPQKLQRNVFAPSSSTLRGALHELQRRLRVDMAVATLHPHVNLPQLPRRE